MRTGRHPAAVDLPPGLHCRSFDDQYETAGDFGEVYAGIVDRILDLGQRPEGVVYAVPGDPMVGEATVTALLSRSREAGMHVQVLPGVSFIEPTLAALGLDALPGLQIIDALEVAARNHPPINPNLPAMVAQLYSRRLASDCKLTLMNLYPDAHDVSLVVGAGTREQRLLRLPLYELDHHEDITHLTTLFVPALAEPGGLEDLQDTVAHLRAPGGCPWDREQTHASLIGSLLEETYEVASAIDEGDLEALVEELGDLLLQVVLHAQIATEEGEFKMYQVITGIDGKLKHRHPHVWGDVEVRGADHVVERWEKLKRIEKGEDRSVLDGVPPALPALSQADAYGRRAARVGFDWPEAEGVVDKIQEEIAELRAATTAEDREAELGDLLLAVANWARWLGVDPETALRKANARYARRFRWVELAAKERGWDAAQSTIEELETLWREAKSVGDSG
jgi:tetrapyrrole methylase family protein/MazG family protein